MSDFEPRLDILPGPQRRLVPDLAGVPPQFVLYGEAALALRLGHRQSVDFDFFSSAPFEPAALQTALGWQSMTEVLQFQPNTLTVAVHRGEVVKVSFFGGLSCFVDGDLPKLPVEVKEFLAEQACRVAAIPPIPRLSDRIAPQAL